MIADGLYQGEEVSSLEAADLAEVFDSEAIATDIITNQVEFSQEQIKALGQFFQVDPGVFL